MSTLNQPPVISFHSEHICWHAWDVNVLKYWLRGLIIEYTVWNKARISRLAVVCSPFCMCVCTSGRFTSSCQPFRWPVGGTKIVLCLLPRLQHWQHDVAIHSQYCISLAFCEKVAANLSPQSTACQCEEGSSDGIGWRESGQLRPGAFRPVPLITEAPPTPNPPPPHSFSASVCSPSLQIKAIAPAGVWWVKIRAISMQAHVSLFLFAGTGWLEEERGVEWRLNGSHKNCNWKICYHDYFKLSKVVSKRHVGLKKGKKKGNLF